MKFCGSLLCILWCVCTSCADRPFPGKVTDYFAAYLAGEKEVFQDTLPIPLADIEEMRQMVWGAWQVANQNLEEQKLPALKPLASAKSNSWALPAELEPHASMPYYWGYKGDDEPEGGYPLFIYAHGSGAKEDEWVVGRKICQAFEDEPSVYFIPQIPNEGEYYRWWQKAKQFAWEKLLRQAFVSGDIDPNRVYCFGISEGGYGSQRLASFYADYLAGAGPMAGGEPLKNAPVENCRNLAFSMLTGAEDRGFYRNLLTQYTKDEFERLQALYPDGYAHRIELIPGYGHAIDYTLTTPWLKQYVRNPYPKQVNWENFEMDGRYRDGFYNLYVKERSNASDKTRTYYRMDIEDNRVALQVDEVAYNPTEIDPQWGIQLKFQKSSRPATNGKVLIYLCNYLVDLSREVTVTVNGKEAFRGMLKPDLKHLVNSCIAFYDPARLYPAAVEIDLADINSRKS